MKNALNLNFDGIQTFGSQKTLTAKMANNLQVDITKKKERVTEDLEDQLDEDMMEIKLKRKKEMSELDFHVQPEVKSCWRIPEKYIISYKSRFKIWWDNIVMLSAIYVSLYFPFSFAFDTYYESRNINIGQLIFDILFVMDIGLMFITSTITKKGYETKDSVVIRNEYIKTRRFAFDVGSVLSIQLFTQRNRIFQFFGLFKMTRITRIQSMIAKSSFDNDTKAGL